ncbi:helix-turn-helix domain-containing protein [Streptococcus castoreus]|uniref:helix-turn-helix domain-containing protein n=1 Tax=Streptococcus castoreus TaxID=254786 RepID=UPI00042526B6|nr:helix-turn-helix transcriptional regulator [Streptococcus castoreus]
MPVKKTFFASNLKYLRLKKNMEQLELANLLGRKSSSSISEWEKGKYTPKSGLLSDIAAIFDVSLTALMEEDLTLENKGVTYQLPQRNLVMISEQLTENNYNKWLDFAQILLEQQAKEDSIIEDHSF